MSSIDERIVEMKFDNGQFKSGVKDTQQAIEQLKSGLKLEGASGGLEKITAAAGRFSLEGIASAIENISSKFNIFGAIGFTVIQSLTNSALAFGRTLVANVLDPLIEGGKRRALNIEQAKFQFQGLGLDIEATMAAALYAVKGTAFGLDEAAKAAASLGASQVPIEKMGSTLRAISGVAALTGSEYADVADVFTKVAGQGRLMGDDLNRLASRGMNAAATLAKALGTTEADVRDMVSKNKISFEMFAQIMDDAFGAQATKASDTYTGALANMRAALSRIGAVIATANFERLRLIFNALAPQIDNIATALKPATDRISELLLKSGESFSAWVSSIDLTDFTNSMPYAVGAVNDVLRVLGQILAPIKDAFKEIFPPVSATILTDIANAITQVTSKFNIAEGTALKIKNTFKGFFAILDIGRMVLVGFVDMIVGLFSEVEVGKTSILDLTSNFGEWLVKLRDGIRDGEGLTNFFTTFGTVLSVIFGGLGAFGKLIGSVFEGLQKFDIKNFGQSIKDFFTGLDLSGFSSAFDNVKRRLESLKDAGSWIYSLGAGARAAFSNFAEWITPGLEAIKGFGGKVIDAFKESFTKGNFSPVLDVINTGLLGGIVLLLKNFFNGGLEGLIGGGDWNGFLANVQGVFDGITGSLEAMQTKIKADTLIKIAIAVGILAASVILLSLIDPAKLTQALVAMAILFALMSLALDKLAIAVVQPGMEKLPVVAGGLILLSVSVLILASAVKSMAELEWDDLAKGLLGVAFVMGVLVGATKLIKPELPGLFTTAVALVVLAAAIKIMASAVKDFAELSWNDLAKGLVATGAVLGGLMLFNKFAKVNPASAIQAIGILLLAAALKVLSSVVKDFSDMQWDEIARGLVTLAGALGIIAGAMQLMPKNMILTGAGLVVVAYALGILADALSKMGDMGWDEIAKAGVVLLGSLALIAGGLYLMTGTLPGAAALIVAAAAFQVLMGPLERMGKLGWEEIGKIMTTLAGSLIIMAIGLTAMIASLPGAAALVVAAAALAVFVPVLEAMGGLEWDTVGMGLTVLGLSLLVLAVGGIALLPALPGLMGLGLAIALIGAGVFLASAGVVAFAGAITLLSGAGLLTAETIKMLIRTVLEQIPYALEQFGLGVVAFIQVISDNQVAFATAFGVLIQTLLDAINYYAPQIIDTLWMLLMKMADKIEQNVPVLVDKGGRLIAGVLQGIANNMQNIITAGTNLIIAFLRGVDQNMPRITQAGADTVISFVRSLANTIETKGSQMRAAGRELAFAIVDGMTGGLLSGASRVIAAAGEMAGKALAKAQQVLDINSPSKEFRKLGDSAGEGMYDGLVRSTPSVENAAGRMSQAAIDAAQESMARMSRLIADETPESPVIVPVLDLSEVKKDAGLIDGMFGATQVGAYKTASVAASMSSDSSVKEIPVSGGQTPVSTGPSFTQIVNSPKPISQLELYRQTKNLLSSGKGVPGSND